MALETAKRPAFEKPSRKASQVIAKKVIERFFGA